MHRIIVAHPHRQHSYRLASALNDRGILLKYVTTIYNKKGTLTHALIPRLRGMNRDKAEGRHFDGIPDEKVLLIGEVFELLNLLLVRIVNNDKRIMLPYTRFISWYFGRKLARYAIKNNADAVICYDTECVELFRYLKKKAPSIARIMDVSAANRIYQKTIYEEDIIVEPRFAENLKKERYDLFSSKASKMLELYLREINDTDYFLIPSRFVECSLKYSGVQKEKMIYCPYGVELSKFKLKEFEKKKGALEAIYVGGVMQLKGISYLIKAFMEIDPRIARLTIVGRIDASLPDIEKYKDRVRFIGSVVHSDIPNLLRKADVFVFPSLGDSFSLSALEAAACGLPLIVSENTGMNDGMTNGKEGYIIPVHSKQAIKEKVLWFAENRDKIEEMGRAARKMAESFTWEKYSERIADSIYRVVKNHKLEEESNENCDSSIEL